MDFVTQIDNKMKALNCFDVLVAAFEMYNVENVVGITQDDEFSVENGSYNPDTGKVILYFVSMKGTGYWSFEFYLDPANLKHKCVYLGRDYIDLCALTHPRFEIDYNIISKMIH